MQLLKYYTKHKDKGFNFEEKISAKKKPNPTKVFRKLVSMRC